MIGAFESLSIVFIVGITQNISRSIPNEDPAYV